MAVINGAYYEDHTSHYDIQTAIELISKPGRVYVWVQILVDETSYFTAAVKGDLLSLLKEIASNAPDAVVEMTSYGDEWIVGV